MTERKQKRRKKNIRRDDLLKNALHTRNIKTIKLVLDNPFLKIGSSDKATSVCNAADNGLYKIVKLLLKDKRFNPAGVLDAAIRWSSAKGHLKIVNLLLDDKRVDATAWECYAFREACKNGHIDVCKTLWRRTKVDVTARSMECLYNATTAGHFDVLLFLIEECDVLKQYIYVNRVNSVFIKNDIIEKILIYHGAPQPPQKAVWDHTKFKYYEPCLRANIKTLLLYLKKHNICSDLKYFLIKTLINVYRIKCF